MEDAKNAHEPGKSVKKVVRGPGLWPGLGGGGWGGTRPGLRRYGAVCLSRSSAQGGLRPGVIVRHIDARGRSGLIS